MGRHKKPFSTSKECNKCAIVKPLDDFYKDKTKGDGHCTVCKACDKAYNEANKDSKKAYQTEYSKAYREANKERIKAYQDAYRQAHAKPKSPKPIPTEKTCTDCKQVKPLTDFHKNGNSYHSKCKACKNAQRREYQQTTAGNDANRLKDTRERVKRYGVKHIPYKPSEIFKRDNFTCKMCGKADLQGRDLTIDHIFPLEKGGHDVATNLQTACRRCNSVKRNKMYFWSIPDETEVLSR